MKTPESLVGAVDCGVIQEVVRPLMSGKEAQVFVVMAAGTECVAKVYKEASQRTFKHRAQYTEGRRTRNTRDQRAMSKRSRHGRSQDEAGWRNTEVDMIYRLRDAGVRVPEPLNFVDGVLVMELVKDAEGHPAARLGDLSFSASEAGEIYQQLLREVVRMLCAGVIHGDLSEFNVLMGAQGPVVIDFPQSMDAARNQGARKFLLRDVDNLHRFVERHAPGQATRTYGQEIWQLYEANRLEPETSLRGDYRAPENKADTGEVLALIEDAERDEHARRGVRRSAPMRDVEARPDPSGVGVSGVEAPRRMRTVVDFTKDARPRPKTGNRPGRGRSSSTNAVPLRAAATPTPGAPAAAAVGDAAPRKRRARRRRKRGPTTDAAGIAEAKARGPEGAAKAERTGKDAADPRGASRPAAGGAARPARRRRRRTRSTASREPS